MHQPVGHADGGGFICGTSGLIAAQKRIAARILSFCPRLRQHFRQAHDVAQTEVKSLPGNRMQRLRRVADQRQPMRNRAAGSGERERIHAALSGMDDPAKTPAECLLKLMTKAFVRPAQHLIMPRLRMTPHQRAAALRHGQHRQRAVEGKAFKRAPAMRLRGTDVGDNRQLFIGFLLPADTAAGPQRRTRAIGGDQQFTAEGFAVVQNQAYALFAAADIFHLCRAVQRHARRFAQLRKQALANIVQLDHLAQRRQPILFSLERHKPRVAAIADVNALNGRGAVGYLLPDIHASQLLAGTGSQSDGAGIKARMLRGIRR